MYVIVMQQYNIFEAEFNTKYMNLHVHVLTCFIFHDKIWENMCIKSNVYIILKHMTSTYNIVYVYKNMYMT